jgi:hypothetical protein
VTAVTIRFGQARRADAERQLAYKKKPELVTFYSRPYWEYRFPQPQRIAAAPAAFRFLAPGNTVILDSPCS